MSDKILIQVKFSEETKYGTFSDILYYSPEEYSEKTEEEIIAEKQARVDSWVNLMDNPAPFHEDTPEEIQARLDELEVEKQKLLEQQDNLT